MNRRGFLTLSGITASVAVVTTLFGLRFLGTSLEKSIERIVRHYIGDDRLVPGASSKFAKELVRLHDAGSLSQTPLSRYISKKWLGRLVLFSMVKTEQFERAVITAFIEASDLSSMPDKLTKPIDYVGFRPVRVCNPFAHFLA